MEYRRLATPPPTEELRGREYYHGTGDRLAFNGVREKGLIPNFKPKHEGKFSAQEGRGYLTSDIGYAICYAFTGGANWDFLEMSPEKRDYHLYPPDIVMGYILVFDGNDLGDVEPDEDKVIKMVHEKKFPWLNTIAKKFYRDGVANGLAIDLDDYYELVSKDAWWWDSLHYGKQLITMMSPEQRLEICEAGGSVANQGIIHPVAGWKLSCKKVDKLNNSGTNFFELAEWIF